jgi:hypothetical protein
MDQKRVTNLDPISPHVKINFKLEESVNLTRIILAAFALLVEIQVLCRKDKFHYMIVRFDSRTTSGMQCFLPLGA